MAARKVTPLLIAGCARSTGATARSVSKKWCQHPNTPSRTARDDCQQPEAAGRCCECKLSRCSYLRRSQQDAWQHETTTLRKAGQQMQRKLTAVQLALATEPELVSELGKRLGLEPGAPASAMCGWIVDTSIECDHQRFGDFLKISVEELLIALRDDSHLLHDPDGIFAPTATATRAEPQSLYPQGFSAVRLIEVVETQAVWDGI